MSFPPDDLWFRRLIEQQKQFEKLNSPYTEMMKQQQRLIDSVNFPSFEYQKDILLRANINDYLSLAGISNVHLTLQQEIESRLNSIGSFATELDFLKKSAGVSSFLEAQEGIYRLQDQVAKSRELCELPSDRISSVLAAAEATSRLLSPPKFFLTLLFQLWPSTNLL